VANTVSSLISIFTLVRFGRKTLLMFGQVVMGVCCIAAGLCLIFKAYIWTYILILAFIFAFSIGTGSVAWVYCSEVTMDKASGFVIGAMFATSLVYTLTMEYMMASKMKA
jgi:MFS family permease